MKNLAQVPNRHRDHDILQACLATSPSSLLESFIVGEIARQLSWSDTEATMFHWRDRDGAEVDIVLEQPNGNVVGIEVKASFDVHAGDAKGLRALRDRLGLTFVAGIVLHCGDRVQRLDEQIVALPNAVLWSP